MDYKQLIDELLQELSYRVGIVDIYNKEHQSIMSEILSEWGEIEAKETIFNFLNEEEPNKNDDRYVSIGFGRFKLKGKEGEDDPTYEKDEKGNYIKISDDEGGDSDKSVETGKSLKSADYQQKIEKEKEVRQKMDSENGNSSKTESIESNIPDYQIKHYHEVVKEESV